MQFSMLLPSSPIPHLIPSGLIDDVVTARSKEMTFSIIILLHIYLRKRLWCIAETLSHLWERRHLGQKESRECFCRTTEAWTMRLLEPLSSQCSKVSCCIVLTCAVRWASCSASADTTDSDICFSCSSRRSFSSSTDRSCSWRKQRQISLVNSVE